MPKFQHHHCVLPPARLGESEFRAIKRALGGEFDGATDWNFWSGHTLVSNRDFEALLEEVRDLGGLSDFEIVADIGDAGITISGAEGGCFVEYETSHAKEPEIAERVRAVEGIFRDNRRRCAVIPRPLAAIPGVRRWTLSPSIKIGAQRQGITLDWNDIWQKAITNWLSHLGTAFIAFLLGVLIGWLGF